MNGERVLGAQFDGPDVTSNLALRNFKHSILAARYSRDCEN